MSTALSKAIFARLSGVESLTDEAGEAQAALATLLATDPDTTRPAIFFGNKNATQVWVSGDVECPPKSVLSVKQVVLSRYIIT